MGAIYKEHNKLAAVEVVYRTAADSLNDMASGAIDYGMYDNIFAAAQERAGRVRILAVSTPTRLDARPSHSHHDRAWHADEPHRRFLGHGAGGNSGTGA